MFSEEMAKAPTNAMLANQTTDEQISETAMRWPTMTPREKVQSIKDGLL